MQIVEQMRLKNLHKQRSTISDTENGFVVKKTMDVEPIIQAVAGMSELERPVRSDTGALYLGSIDLFTARNWSKECGHAVGTKEWTAYAKIKLLSGEYSKFVAKHRKRYT